MGFADLHIHSYYSDGTLSPEEIVIQARARNVELISVCDHNEVRGTLEAAQWAKRAGVRYLTGAEIDAIWEGTDVHILCYGADLSDANLLARIRHARTRLDGMSTELLARMLRDGANLSAEEYAAFPFDTARGGWKMLQYLQFKAVTPDLKSGIALYDRYGVRYADAGFDAAAEVVAAIHGAGGRAVLAHPGVIFPVENLRAFLSRVEAALELGLDGVECDYPAHSAGMVRSLRALCARRGAMATAGSDCHGAFNRREIGCTRTPVSEIDLRGLATEMG